jgi:hypothetical protein
MQRVFLVGLLQGRGRRSMSEVSKNGLVGSRIVGLLGIRSAIIRGIAAEFGKSFISHSLQFLRISVLMSGIKER